MRFWSKSSDFRLGGGQYDNCPHCHRTAEAAARCDWFDAGIVRQRETVVRNGRQLEVGSLREIGY